MLVSQTTALLAIQYPQTFRGPLPPMFRLLSPTMVPSTVVGLAAAAVVLLVGLGPIPTLVVAAVVAAGSGIVVDRRSAGAVRRALAARPALAGEFPRLHNTVDGLCLTHGIEHPGLFVIDSPAGNAAALAGPDGASIVLTTGAADRLGLVELEALVAHLLARCADGRLRIETTAAAMGRIPGASLGLTARSDGPDRVIRTDLHGADLTRFPPGMQSALRALAELGATVDVPSSTARLWLLQPDGRTDVQTSIHPTVDLRVAALEEC